MRILIVRHAEPDYQHDSLTEKGRLEAALLARRLASIPAQAYYVSPLGRARETANYTLYLVKKEAVILPWLEEFRCRVPDPDTGRVHRPWDFRASAWQDHPLLMDRDGWPQDPMMADSEASQIWQETKAGIDTLLLHHGYRRQGGIYLTEHNTDDTLVLFCHFGIGMAMLAYLTGLPPLPLWQSFLFLPASITTLVTQERLPGQVEFRCLCLGDVSHLIEAGEPPSLAGLFPECFNGVESTDPDAWPAPPKRHPLL